MIELDQFSQTAERLKALAHPIRLHILTVLLEQDYCYTGEIAEELPFSQPTVSQHLKILKEAGLIRGTIEAPRIRYCLNREALAELEADLNALFSAKKCSRQKVEESRHA